MLTPSGSVSRQRSPCSILERPNPQGCRLASGIMEELTLDIDCLSEFGIPNSVHSVIKVPRGVADNDGR